MPGCWQRSVVAFLPCLSLWTNSVHFLVAQETKSATTHNGYHWIFADPPTYIKMDRVVWRILLREQCGAEELQFS